jgi:hypothetical protein
MGRTKKLTEQVGVVLSPETYKTLKEVTDKLEVSVSEFVRMTLEKELYDEGEEININE